MTEAPPTASRVIAPRLDLALLDAGDLLALQSIVILAATDSPSLNLAKDIADEIARRHPAIFQPVAD